MFLTEQSKRKGIKMAALDNLLDLLNADLRNEYRHMLFYLYHSTALVGLHAEEYKEIFAEEAKSEMEHVREFSDLIYGLGGDPRPGYAEFPQFTSVRDAVEYAYKMETEVVANYAERIKQAQNVLEPDATWVEVFLEDQIAHSRKDADRFKRLLM